jgi:hypothetical protein
MFQGRMLTIEARWTTNRREAQHVTAWFNGCAIYFAVAGVKASESWRSKLLVWVERKSIAYEHHPG